MTTLHMQTETMRDTASGINRGAMELEYRAGELRSLYSRLGWAWSGPGSSRFRQDFRAWLNRYQAHVHELEHLALRVAREVDEWETMDQTRNFGPDRPGAAGILPDFLKPVRMPYLPVGPLTFFDAYPWIPGARDRYPSLYPWLPGMPLPFLITTGLAVGNWANNQFDQWSITREGFFGYSDHLSDSSAELKLQGKLSADGELYDAENQRGDLKFLGLDYGDTDRDFRAGVWEVGLKGGVDEEGEFSLGAFGEVHAVEATSLAVVGGSMLGITKTSKFEAGSVEAFAGIKDGSLGASIGGSLASVEGGVGVNVAGVNVGVKVGVSAGVELGVKVGKDTAVKLGPFKVGLSFGEAKTV